MRQQCAGRGSGNDSCSDRQLCRQSLGKPHCVCGRLQLCSPGVSGLTLYMAAGVDGTTLKEAKYINLSLHYLEQVIIALQDRSTGLGR